MRITCATALFALLLPVQSAAQGATAPTGAPPPAQVATPAVPDPYADDKLGMSEPDFTLGVLPTTLRVPKGKLAFRITHRFDYPLNDNSFSDIMSNALGFDSSAHVGMELRFGVAEGTQVSVHRTNKQQVQFMAQHQVQAQRANGRFSADILLAIEGQENFGKEHSIVFGGVVSRQVRDAGAVYLEPMVILNATPELPASDENTFLLAVGARFRVFRARSSYVVVEFAPRLGGYDGGSAVMSFGIEKRTTNHGFQLNVSNGFGTTLTQVGRGGPVEKNWHVGLNLTRKFY